jgi:hypothetical protein
MSNISIKVNLKQLKHVEREMKGLDGKMIKCLIIPLDENLIYQGEKGAYLNLTAIEIKDRSKFLPDQKDTHLVKQDIPKEKYDAMSDEQRKAMPILGNAILWGRKEPAPNESSEMSNSAVDAYLEEQDDLPFN